MSCLLNARKIAYVKNLIFVHFYL